MSQFDFFEHLLKHGLEHIIEEILLLLPVEDLLCRVNAVSRLWRKIVDQLEGQWEARKRSLFWRDPQLTSWPLHPISNYVDKSSRNLVAQHHKLERAWKHLDTFDRKAFESIPLSLSLDSLRDRLAVGLNDGSVELFKISTSAKLWLNSNCHSKGVKSVLLWLDHDLILTASYDHTICLWILNGDQGMNLMQTVTKHNDGVWDLQRDMVEHQPWVASAGMDGLVLLFKYDDDKVALDIESKWCIEHEEFTCVQLCSRLGLIASGGDTGQVHILNFNSSDEEKRVLKHRHGISGLQFVPRSSSCIEVELLLTAGHDSKLRLWNIENDTCLAIISGHRDAIRTLDSSYTRIASADYSGFVRVWQISEILQALKIEKERLDRRSCSQLKKHQQLLPELFVPHRSFYANRNALTVVRLDAFTLATGSRDKSVCLWNFGKSATFSPSHYQRRPLRPGSSLQPMC